jgi:hypothetical protein
MKKYTEIDQRVVSIWIEHHGTAVQKRAWKAQALDPEEILTEIRDHLFESIEAKGYFAFEPINTFQICPCHDTQIAFQSTTGGQVNSAKFAVFEDLQKLALEAGGHAELKTHKGVCKDCCKAKAKVACLVTIIWEGRPFSREYELIQPKN